jgi:hypothetical protein
MISFFAVAQNDSIGRVRYQLLEVINITPEFDKPFYTLRNQAIIHLRSFFQKMLQPCGPPPLKDEEDPGAQD